jgi:FMN-dependent oxidoreductase (nitrilotriacetate monooxygenase family)
LRSDDVMAGVRRPLRFALFTTNSPSGYPGSPWNQPLALDHDYRSLTSWMDLARKLEDARFDAIFWADHSGVYDTYEGSRDAAVRQAVQFPINDPSALVPALATVTQNLGFAFSANVIQEHPYSFARRVATLDHLTEGRVAWNIVTSFQRSAWRNVGFEQVADHAERYARAEEYVDVVYQLLEGSWDDGAVVRNVPTGVYTDPAAVHEIEHAGRFYSSAGPICVEPSPQRLPVLFQAGSSADGRTFAARNAEAIFIAAKNPRGAASVVEDMRRLVVDQGRAQGDVLVFQQFSCIVAATEEEAQRKADEMREWLSDEANLAYTSATMGLDLSTLDLDTPIVDLDTDAMQGKVRALAEAAPDKQWTFREVVAGLTTPHFVGTADRLVDAVAEWAAAGVDGLNVAFLNGLGEIDDFIQYAVPELQKHGLMQSEYAPGTFREKLLGSTRISERHPAASYRRAPAAVIGAD